MYVDADELSLFGWFVNQAGYDVRNNYLSPLPAALLAIRIAHKDVTDRRNS